MIEINNPGLLFQKQKQYRLSPELKTDKQSRRVLVLYESPQQVLSGPAKTMLDKLVKACKFSETEVAFIHDDGSISLANLQNQYSPEVILVFGNIQLSRNMQPVAKNHPYEISGIKVIQSIAPEMLNTNDKEKAALWNALKQGLNL